MGDDHIIAIVIAISAGIMYAGNQISSRMMNMVEAECLLHLPAATPSAKTLPAGSVVDAEFINPNLTRTTDIVAATPTQ